MAQKGGEQREPPNAVHQDAIHCETVKKELKSAVIYQHFTINPHTLKKNSKFILIFIDLKTNFFKLI